MHHFKICIIFLLALCVCSPILNAQSNRTRPSAGKTEHVLDIPVAARKVVSVLVEGVSGEPDVQGSGFFVDSQGTLITNHHVIKNAASASVRTSDGAYYLVKGVLADDAEHDLAVLKVEGRNFKPLPLGDSTKVRLGDRVIAIGSPLGLESTVSDGIVSGLREDGDSEVIQTTAPISHGSSGGVLLNSRGEVIGVTTFFSREGQNINFAIPSNNIRPLLMSSFVHPFNPPPQKLLAKQYEAPKTPYEVPKTTKIEPSVPKAAPCRWVATSYGGYCGDDAKPNDVPKTTKIEPPPMLKRPQELGKQWVRVEDGTGLYVRQTNDLLQFQGDFFRDEQTRVYFTCTATRKCEWAATSYGGYCAPDKGHEWNGLCTYTYLGPQRLCNVNRTVQVSSLSPNKIEGTLQAMTSGRGDSCPSSAPGSDSFTLIPSRH
jgi:hypothetical protein